MRSFKQALAILLYASLAWGQGSYRSDSAFNNLGVPIPNPTVRVCTLAATGIPCSPTASVFTDQTLTTQAQNPFTGDAFGNFNFYAAPGWYQVQVSGPGVSPVTYKVLLPPDVGNLLAANITTITSATTPNAATGFVRQGASDSICWRNQANTADVCLSKNVSDQIVGAAASAPLISQTANPAATGQVRLAASDILCWRNQANTADVCISKNGSDQLTGINATASAPFISAALNPAATGTLRLSNADQICARNAANNADLCASLNSSNLWDFSSAPVVSAGFVSSQTNPASVGLVRMATTDATCFRNFANTGDICIGKNNSDNVTIPSLLLGADTVAISNTPRSTWAISNTATSTATGTHGETTVMAPIKILSFDVLLGTTPAGCTTAAIYALRVGGVTQLSLTAVNGTAYYHTTGSVNVASAALLTFEVTQAEAGCTTSGGSPRYTIWFAMQ